MTANPNEIQLPDFLLVHPELKDDPVNKQGKIGFVTAAILNADEFYLGFDDGEVGLYSADALLALKPAGDIYDFMHGHALVISVNDFKDLKNIALLLDHGSEKHFRTAMELVRKNESIREAATIGLDRLLGLKPARNLKR
jgi:hypothetical protein